MVFWQSTSQMSMGKILENSCSGFCGWNFNSLPKFQYLFPGLFQLCVAVIQPFCIWTMWQIPYLMSYCHPCSGRLEALSIAALLVAAQFIYSRQLFHLPLKDTRLYHRKTKKTRAPCLYYPNSSASRQLLLRGGDVSVNPGPSTKDCHLKCLSLNAQSPKSKQKAPRSEMFCRIHAFQKLVYSNAYDIICVTETWLKDFFLDSEILDTGYSIFRRDRA